MATSIGPGDRIDGKYVVERLLGRGGMGAVFVAVHQELNRRVAIKVLLPGVEQSEEALTRFTREARAAAALQSDHVARVLDVGRLPNGNPYTVMELLEGEDLSALVSRVGTLPVPEAIQIVLQTCDAIAEAHALGIVHRDIKPANIFLARRPNGSGTVKVLDFGISKAAGLTGSPSLTASFALMGSPLYMSPEQLREARAVDGRADIWALGVTLYELLTGTTPFAAGALAEICTNILTVWPRSMRSLRHDVPEALDGIVMRCLEKAPEDRFAHVQDLVAALESVPCDAASSGTLSADTFAAESRRLAPASGSAPARSTTSAVSHTPLTTAVGRPRRSRALPVGIAVVILAAAAVTSQRMLREPDAPPLVAQHPLPSPPVAAVAPPPVTLVVSPPSPAAPSVSVAPDPPSVPIPIAKPATKHTVSAGSKPPPPSASSHPPPPPATPSAPAEAPPANPLDLPFR